MHLVDGLRREFGSHLRAELMGWGFAAGYGELMAGIHAQAYIAAHSRPGAEPVQLPFPWTAVDAPQVTSEELARLKEQLEARSAFAQ